MNGTGILSKKEEFTPLMGTLPQILAMQASRYGRSGAAIREKAYGIWQTFSWEDYLRYVKHTALGLLAIGFCRGDRAGLITGNHPEWLFAELGAQAVGGITLNLFTSAVADEISASLKRIRTAVVFAQDQEQVDKLIAVRDRIDHVRRVIYIDPTGMDAQREDPWLLSFAELLSKGEELDRTRPDLFTTEMQLGRADETALMIQTSGTTGLPKMACLSHGNLTAIGEGWIQAVSIRAGENWISISPPIVRRHQASRPWTLMPRWSVLTLVCLRHSQRSSSRPWFRKNLWISILILVLTPHRLRLRLLSKPLPRCPTMRPLASLLRLFRSRMMASSSMLI